MTPPSSRIYAITLRKAHSFVTAQGVDLAEQRGWKVIAPHHEQAGGFMATASIQLLQNPG